ncbi:AraC family transcriptional regulator [Nocardia cyriacigeorgica]|uniref:AraC family transcriptional regulator n=1 Tax=Nocardia cyriacigeorgica TaxID=135487 RepID=UPI002B4B9547|nr:AraC family transcriptional regulator ligand-binding domain-containing protein [Nocardia cyriacigeorgica]
MVTGRLGGAEPSEVALRGEVDACARTTPGVPASTRGEPGRAARSPTDRAVRLGRAGDQAAALPATGGHTNTHAGGHRGTAPAGTLTGTASTQLIRLVRDTALRAGVAPERIAVIHGVSDDALRGELDRVPMRSLMRLWELLAGTGPAAGLAVVEDAPLGRLSTWDYLVTTGATLADSFTAAQPYHQLVTAATEGFDLRTAGELTVGYRTGAGDPAVAAVVNEYVLGYYLRRAREGLGRNVVPARITFSHPAPREHRLLTEAFGTARIDFDAPADTITFTEADAAAPLARADPALAALLRSHAELVLASARPIAGPLDEFRTALATALDTGIPTLTEVAARLAMSPRSLQRRLAENATTWSHELDQVRYRRAEELLSAGSTTAGVAARLGFADDRALRKAFRRWSGESPGAVRRR